MGHPRGTDKQAGQRKVVRLHPAPDESNIDYKKYCSILRTLSMTPGMYEKDTGWSAASQVEFQRLKTATPEETSPEFDGLGL